jgi:hypothetical protein
MTTYTDSHGFNKNSAGFPAHGLNRFHFVEVELDFAAIAAARLAAGATALAATDVLEVIPIPAKTHVLKVGADVITAEGATLTLDVGDGDDPDGWLDGINANTVAGYVPTTILAAATPDAVIGYGFAGKYYAAADTIDVLINNNGANVAVVKVWALMVDIGGDLGSVPGSQ